MNTPTIFKPETIREISNTISRKAKDGNWVPCRPLGWQGLALRKRLKAAWLVFTGRCDVVQWDDNQ